MGAGAGITIGTGAGAGIAIGAAKIAGRRQEQCHCGRFRRARVGRDGPFFRAGVDDFQPA